MTDGNIGGSGAVMAASSSLLLLLCWKESILQQQQQHWKKESMLVAVAVAKNPMRITAKSSLHHHHPPPMEKNYGSGGQSSSNSAARHRSATESMRRKSPSGTGNSASAASAATASREGTFNDGAVVSETSLRAKPCTTIGLPLLISDLEQSLLKSLCNIVTPPRKPLNLKIFPRRAPTQEEYFRGSLSRNPIGLSSLRVACAATGTSGGSGDVNPDDRRISSGGVGS